MALWPGLIVLVTAVAACSSAGSSLESKVAAQGLGHGHVSQTRLASPSPSPSPLPPPPQVTLSSFHTADGTVITLAQLDVASQPGDQLSTAIPGQNRPADQFIVGWTRDFVTLLG